MNPLGAIGLGATGIGLLGGALFGNDQEDAYRNRLNFQYNNTLNRQAPQAGPASLAQNSGFRGNQSELISRLEALSKGQGPSLAAQQFRAATDQNMKSQQALQAGGRGGPLAAFNAAGNMANLGAQAAQGSALARTNEQMQAFGQLGGAIGQGRAQDQETSQFNAMQQNFRDKDNLEAKLRTMGYNDSMIQSILQQQGALASKPTGWDQLTAGGAGLLSLGATMGGGSNRWANGQTSRYPGGY